MWGHSDLELPVHALKDREPTYVMLDAVAEGQGREENHVELVVPLHLRYTEPRSGGGYERVEMAWPMAFSVCPSAHNTPKPSFLDTLPPPFQSPFGGGTHSIMTIPSCTEGGPNPIHEFFIPIGNSDHLPIVQFGTAAFVLFSFFWVGSAILRTLPRQRNGAHSCIIDSKSE
ncbi:hypothetical protein FRB95_002760 [Tulasnella sp. JGI-2019a]|nr:hypothetical protein FRB93_001802 [Tulasnella sp. JGI-2019a]KAG9031396.1 hypothetical protein FRB95_002760 [Tulasnella sp. JGI-2019a]